MTSCGFLFSKVSELPAKTLEEAMQDSQVSDEAKILPSGVSVMHANHDGLDRTYLGMLFLNPFAAACTQNSSGIA